MNRRGFLQVILAAGVAPFVVTTAGVLTNDCMDACERMVKSPY